MAGKFMNSLRPKDWVRGSLVGSGSFGVVNLAMNKSTGELFVVKSAPPGEGFQSLKNEFDILEGLESPYIVRCLGHDLSDGTHDGERKLFNLFMEFMAGGSLSEIVNKFGGALSESVIRSYTKEILKGIQYLHGSGIVHCDLKCKNVLLGSSGNVKLADFGCAKRMCSSNIDAGSKKSWQSICGTPLWMAPEVLQNEGVGFASDIWSLGCTVVEMATGMPPWGDAVSNPMAAVFKIACTNETPKLPTNFSEEGLDFLNKCLQRDPKLRWSCEELLNHPFVTGNLEGKYPSREDSCSPTSILDSRLGEGNLELDEPESPTPEANPMILPFSMRRGGGEGESEMRKNYEEIDVVETDVWHLVRSG